MKLKPEINLSDEEKLLLINEKLRTDMLEKDELIAKLRHQLSVLRVARFGRKTEKYCEEQLGLFDEAELEVSEKETEVEEVTVIVKKKVKQPGRKPLPKSLPFIEKIIELTEQEQQCDCGCQLSEIGEERSEQLDVVPQLTYRTVTIRKKYACKTCESNIKTAPVPVQPIPKGIATAGLLASIITAKFNYHMPLYRQEDMYNRAGIKLSRSTLSEWVLKVAELLFPLIKLLHAQILTYDIAFADETKLNVLKRKDGKKSQSYMWLFAGGPPEKRSFVYQYEPGRTQDTAFHFFEDFHGYLHADCYCAYVNLDKSVHITHAACIAHARRYFMDIVKSSNKKSSLAVKAIKYFKALYDIEKDLKEMDANTEVIYQKRQTASQAILKEFKEWLDTTYIKVPPKSALGRAFAYSINHWKSLTRYIEDGRLEIDNNRSERAIKPFVIGRKNWLFNDNEKGARAGATIFSLIETCKAHNVDVFSYFKLALSEIKHCSTLEELETLLPFNCKDSDLKKQRELPRLNYPSE